MKNQNRVKRSSGNNVTVEGQRPHQTILILTQPFPGSCTLTSREQAVPKERQSLTRYRITGLSLYRAQADASHHNPCRPEVKTVAKTKEVSTLNLEESSIL